MLAAGAHELNPGPPTPRHSPWPAPHSFPSPAKLRLTRRAWLLLWLIATLIALADAGLLLRGASVTVLVEGHSRSLPAGLTVVQALERLALPAMAGDLLAVDHSVLRNNAYPAQVLVNGRPAPATRRLHPGDRVTVSRGRSRIEPVTRVTRLLGASRPGDPMRSLPTGPARAVLDRGQHSGRMVPVAFHPAAGSRGPLPVALTFDDGPWANSTAQILAILVQRQAPATFFVVGRQVQRYPELVRPADWQPGVSADQLVWRVLAGVRPGAIVLLHDGGGDRSATVAALPAIIDGLRRLGLTLTVVPG